MVLRWLFYAIAVLNVLYGLGFLIVPETVGASYGSGINPVAVTVARYWGATLLPLGFLSWIAATAAGSPLKLALARAIEFTAILNFIVTGLALSSGVINAAGGVLNFILSAVFAIGFGYYGWAKTEAVRA